MVIHKTRCDQKTYSMWKKFFKSLKLKVVEMTPKQQLELYRQLILTRRSEERIQKDYFNDEMNVSEQAEFEQQISTQPGSGSSSGSSRYSTSPSTSVHMQV